MTGKIDKPTDLDAGDWRRTNPRFDEQNFAINRRLVHAATEIATVNAESVARR